MEFNWLTVAIFESSGRENAETMFKFDCSNRNVKSFTYDRISPTSKFINLSISLSVIGAIYHIILHVYYKCYERIKTCKIYMEYYNVCRSEWPDHPSWFCIGPLSCGDTQPKSIDIAFINFSPERKS